MHVESVCGVGERVVEIAVGIEGRAKFCADAVDFQRGAEAAFGSDIDGEEASGGGVGDKPSVDPFESGVGAEVGLHIVVCAHGEREHAGAAGEVARPACEEGTFGWRGCKGDAFAGCALAHGREHRAHGASAGFGESEDGADGDGERLLCRAAGIRGADCDGENARNRRRADDLACVGEKVEPARQGASEGVAGDGVAGLYGHLIDLENLSDDAGGCGAAGVLRGDVDRDAERGGAAGVRCGGIHYKVAGNGGCAGDEAGGVERDPGREAGRGVAGDGVAGCGELEGERLRLCESSAVDC